MIRYLIPLHPGPLTIVRAPHKERGKKGSGLTWQEFLKAMTPVMRSYGLKQRDISNFDPLDGSISKADNDRAEALADKAFDGDPKPYAQFKLWDWRGGKFVLVRDGRPRKPVRYAAVAGTLYDAANPKGSA